jgi:hypothetical protein
MRALSKNTRDNSGHSGHTNRYRGFKHPESMSRLFRTRDTKFKIGASNAAPPAPVVILFALDCAVTTTRLMSWPERTAAE